MAPPSRKSPRSACYEDTYSSRSKLTRTRSCMCHAHPHALHTHPLHTRGKAREHTPPSPPPSGFPQLSPASTLSLVCDTPPYLSLWVASSLHYTPCSQDALSFSLSHGSSSMGSGRTLGERSFSFNTSDLSSGTLFLSPLGMRSSVRHFPPFLFDFILT